MKVFFQKVFDFVTDSNGDGDLLKLFGFLIMVAGVVKFFLPEGAQEAMIAWGFGSGLLAGGKALDAVIPKTANQPPLDTKKGELP